MTQSPTLVRVVASALGVPLAVGTVVESASLGSAILAAVGLGAYASVSDAVRAMTRTRTVAPGKAGELDYDERYRKWRELYDTLQTWTM
jgi:sugar (pentulose or hexulose) kinase